MNKRVDKAFMEIAKSPDELYNAYMNPYQLIKWLPPDGMTGVINHFDGQIGGKFKITLKYNDAFEGKTTANSDVVKGEFVDLIPQRKITTAIYFEADDPDFHGEMIQTWLFEARDGGTLVTIICEDIPVGINQQDHEAGLSSTLANLDKLKL